MDVSVIYVNYKTSRLCADSIQSVLEKTDGLRYEIIVADNNSEDGSAEFLSQTFGDTVKIISLAENIGFGRANNVAIETAAGEFVFLLNTDTLLVNNAIKILYDFIKTDDTIGVVGGNLYDKEMRPNHSFHRKVGLTEYNLFHLYWKMFRRKLCKKREDFNYSQKSKAVDMITGADMLVRKSVLDKTGGFDPDFFMYSEDAELSYRIRKVGYKIISVPQAKIIHYGGMSFDGGAFNERRYAKSFEGSLLYYQKTRSARYAEKFAKKYKRALWWRTFYRKKSIRQEAAIMKRLLNEELQKQKNRSH